MLNLAVVFVALMAGVSAQTASATAFASASIFGEPVTTSTTHHPVPQKKFVHASPKPDPSPKPVITIVASGKKEDVVMKEEKKVEEEVVLVSVKKEEEDECSTIAAAAAATPELSTLVAALQAAGLVEALSDPNLIATVLAPTNEAFEKLLESVGATAEQVLADPQLANILLYHVIGGTAALSTDLEDGMMLTTLLGQEVIVSLASGVTFIGEGSEANVAIPDVVACKAVVHIIDNVLLPDFGALTSESGVVDEPEPVEEATATATATAEAIVTLNI